MKKPPVIAIVGPTGVGKTELSLKIARQLNAEIISVDSRQVYKGMDIGTAKPTNIELTKVPHHLIDVVDATEKFSLATYLEIARVAIRDIQNKGKLAILVGGSGQYMWALLEGWRTPAVPPNIKYREELIAVARNEGVQALYSLLSKMDPKAALSIGPRNERRLVRAMEVIHETGVQWSKQNRCAVSPYTAFIMGLTLPREELYRCIDKRVETMIKDGLVEEVVNLRNKGVSPSHPSMSSVGYRELMLYIDGAATIDEAIRNIKTNTHRFVRRQYSWFRLSDNRINWIKADGDVESRALGLLEPFILK
jgi:tRNA dimethylallyltransferase